MAIRKNVRDLTSTEKQNFITAVKALKDDGTYDGYVLRHAAAAVHPTPSNVDPYYRNAAHRGPAFHPWHRYFLYRFELSLQKRVPGVTLPYWDWAQDAADPKNSPMWAPDFMGGDGDRNDGWLVKTGPFAVDQWTVIDENGEPVGGLQRQFGQNWPTLPTKDEVNTALGETPFDCSNWDASSYPSHRNRLEGWVNTQLHNQVHLWVGGSMLLTTSPNDVCFFLHHCNVDRLWAQWQDLNRDKGYEPTTGGPNGHNLNDLMYPWNGNTGSVLRAAPANVVDCKTLGYTYA